MHGRPRVPVLPGSPHLYQRVDRGRAAERPPTQVRVAESARVRGSENRAIDEVGPRCRFGEVRRRVDGRSLARFEEVHHVAGVEKTRSGNAAPGARTDNDDATTQEDFPASFFSASA